MSKEQRIVLISLCLLITLAIFASDMYLPSLPAMAKALHASHEAVKLTISVYLFGLGCSPLFFGPLSDRFGRRNALLVGLVIALIGSFICAFSNSVYILILGRFIQALGIASGLTLSRTMASDVFKGPRLSQIGSYMGMMFGIMPAIAPTAGGYLQQAYGWRSSFEVLLALIASAFAWVLLVVPETKKGRDRHVLHPIILFKTYWSLVSQKGFIIYPIISGLTFSCFMIYLTISPFLFQNLLNYTPVQFGWLAVIISLGIISGSFCNSRLVKRMEGNKIIAMSNVIMLLASVVMLIFGLFGLLNIYVIMGPMFVITMGTQLVFSNAFSIGMGKITIAAGFASALYTSIQMAGASVASSIASLLHVRSQVPLATMLIIVCLLASMTTFFGVVRLKED